MNDVAFLEIFRAVDLCLSLYNWLVLELRRLILSIGEISLAFVCS